MMYWGAITYMTPRLLGTRSLWSEKLGVYLAYVYNLVIAAGFFGILTGASQGREWAEFPWPIDVAIICIFIALTFNTLMTVSVRRVRPLYVSMWWAIAAPIWVTASIFIENVVWKPGAIWSNPSGALANGIHDAMINWWGNHNLFGLWLTPILVAVVYYFIPRITNTPLYSHTLSLISFWGLIFVYAAVGDHHLLQSPTPGWLKTIASVNSVAILIPVFAFFANVFLTMRGQWNRFFTNLPLRYVLTGFIFYILVNLQGALQAIQPFNIYIHFTYFIIGHSHLALLGGFTILGMGVLYYVVPHVFNKPVYSTGSGGVAVLAGHVRVPALLHGGHHRGLRAGPGLAGGRAGGERAARPQAVEHRAGRRGRHDLRRGLDPDLQPRAHLRERHQREPAAACRRGQRVVAVHPAREHSVRGGVTMADLSNWLPSYQSVPPSWAPHPRKRMLMTPLLVFLGGIFAFAVPTLVAAFFQLMFFNAPISDNWSPLTASAEAGKQVFVANGCIYCHSGYTRPQDVRTGLMYLYPRISLPGDFVSNDSSPNVFGTARIGPDLSQESGFHPDDWERAHFADPRFVEPLSIMPSFEFLTDKQVDDLSAYLQLRAGKNGLVRYAGQLYAKKIQLVSQGVPDPLPGFPGGQAHAGRCGGRR